VETVNSVKMLYIYLFGVAILSLLFMREYSPIIGRFVNNTLTPPQATCCQPSILEMQHLNAHMKRSGTNVKNSHCGEDRSSLVKFLHMGSISGVGGNFCVRRIAHIGPVTHPACYPEDTSGFFPGLKQPDRQVNCLFPYNVDIKKGWSFTLACL
jgi:hypothetical protein